MTVHNNRPCLFYFSKETTEPNPSCYMEAEKMFSSILSLILLLFTPTEKVYIYETTILIMAILLTLPSLRQMILNSAVFYCLIVKL